MFQCEAALGNEAQTQGDFRATNHLCHKFVDPAGIFPFQYDHKTRMSEKRTRTNVVGDILVRGREVCRDQEASEAANGNVIVKFRKKKTQ